ARGRVTVKGRGGEPVTGVPLDFGASAGVNVLTDQPAVTGPDGSLGFAFTPTAATFSLAAKVNADLPGPGLTLWVPTTASVPVQRVVTGGPPTRPAGSVTLAASPTGQVTLVKQSDDPAWLPLTIGFGFDVQRPSGLGGAWATIAHRDTGADGTTAPVTDLPPGSYRVVETTHPAAFAGGGPWTFTLAPGQHATWTMVDHAVAVPVRIAKTGDNVANVPIGAGVAFAVTFDGDGTGKYAAAVGTLTTGADATTSAWPALPGRYRLTEIGPPAGYQAAPPQDFTVPAAAAAGAGGPAVQTVTVSDHAIPGRLAVTKQDATTGAPLGGAVIAISRLDGGASHPIGTWTTTASGPVIVDALPAAPYLLREVHAPAGYQLPGDQAQTVTLAPGQTLAVSFADYALPAPTPTAPAPAPMSTPAPTPSAPVVAGLSPVAPAATPLPGPSSQLAFTGLPVWRLVVAGGASTIAGMALLAVARPGRRRRAPTGRT
nr:SpaA isopeptide-forming pilin-related protein [Actinomycetota bacterium]